MRDVPEVMTSRWRSGDYIGEARPIARITVQKGLVNLYGEGRTLYSSIIFDNPNTPVEFTAVKSVSWDRGVDQDVASANIELWNTADLAVGEQPFSDDELDLPGIYSYQLDGAKYGRLPNDLAQLLVPDNIIRTYEGYGFDAEQVPEKDPNLIITGTWMIDRVSYNVQDGTISVEARDLGRILIDQVAYKPVIPDDHYPLRFEARNTNQGFHAPTVAQRIYGVTGWSSEAYVGGPSTPPTITNPVDEYNQVDGGDGEVTITFDPPTFAPAQEELPEGYTADLGTVFRAPSGYFVRFDAYDNGNDVFHSVEWYECTGPGQANAAIYLYGPATSVADNAIPATEGSFQDLFGGAREVEKYIPRHAPIAHSVYVSSRLQPIFLDQDATQFTLDGLMNGNIYAVTMASVWQKFESSAKQTGILAPTIIVRPSGGAPVSVDVLTGNVTPTNGMWRVSWTHDAGSTPVQWTVIQYQGYGTDDDFVRTHTGATSTPDTAYLDIPVVPGTEDNEYSYLIYGSIGGVTGRGNLMPATAGPQAQFFRPPPEVAPPQFDPSHGGQHPNDPDQVIPRDVVPVNVRPKNSSVLKSLSGDAATEEIANIGRALDDDMGTWWRSERAASQSSRVWMEVDVPNATVSRVRVFTHETPYQMWVHVYADGKWRSYDGGNTIDGVPYIQAIGSAVEGPTDFWFQAPIEKVTKVRLTVSNLKADPRGGWVAKVRHLQVDVPLVEVNEAWPDRYQVREARVVGGAGDRPHTYNDYCADTETEILTRRGWLRYDEVREGDEALAIDPQTGVAGWQVIESVYRQHRRREMVSMESQVHSSLTTPDHRWLVTDQQGRALWRTTETLKTGHRIPLAAYGAAADQAKYEDWFVELVAWFWTEGWWGSRPALAQSDIANPEHVERIRATLSHLGAPGRMLRGKGAMWNERRRDDGVITFALSKPVGDRLREVMDDDKVLAPEFLAALTQSQLDLLIERSIDADGCRTTNGRVLFSQAHEGRIRAFEMALALAGRAFRTRFRDDQQQWVTTVLRHRVTMPQSARVERVDYDGIIWCPTLKHHNWLARRDGTVYFTGNTDIVKLLCAWGGFFWPQDGTIRASDDSEIPYNFGQAPYNLGDNIDVVLGADTGRVWGDFEISGTAGRAKLPVSQFDKKPLMDGINYVRNILGFIFYVDEEGAIVWRQINVFRVGNFILNRSSTPGFTLERVVLDERLNLMDIQTTIDSANVRDKLYVATTNGRHGAVVDGFVENDIGLRRVAGWTDQHFTSDQECEVMATMIAIRQLFTYRTSRITIPGYPRIQINDQVQVRERITQEDFLHFVSEVSSSNDLTTGEWTFDLTTHWLGTDPEEGEWALDLSELLPTVQEIVDVQSEAAGLTGGPIARRP